MAVRSLHSNVVAASGYFQTQWRRGACNWAEAALGWADAVANMAATYDPIALVADDERRLWQDRRHRSGSLYHEVVRMESVVHPSVSSDRLQLAVEGDAVGRVPLCFADRTQFAAFQRDLTTVFKTAKVDDAVVQAIGSSASGWRGNPEKPVAAWSSGSDSDLAVFSATALLAAMEEKKGVGPNRKTRRGGRYVVLKNGSIGTVPGFDVTKLGSKLRLLVRRWNRLVYGHADAVGFDFKINLTTDRFPDAVTVLEPPY